MKVKSLDKSIRKFLILSELLILFSIFVLAAFGYIYRHSNINTYNYILLFLIALTIIITLVFVVTMLAILYTYRRKYVNAAFLWPVKAGLKILLPFVILISGVMKGSKDIIRNFYIDMNNILVKSYNRKYAPEQVLVLLPHCLQHSNCGYKITNDIGNCRRCGKCCIGEIARIAEEMGVKVKVVTGGTAARNIVSKSKPGVILSVACERDLAVGIADVGSIPVMGIVNERPNGPCYNTTVDVKVLRQRLEEIL